MKVERKAVPLIEFELAPEEILARVDAAQTRCDAALGAIASADDAARTFDNTVEALEQAIMDYLDVAQRLGILKEIHTDPAVRRASAQVEENASKYLVQVAARRDLYRAFKAYQARADLASLEPEQRRLFDLTLRDFRRNGLELDDASLARLVAVRSRMAELSTQFAQNLNENTDAITVTEAELAGLPKSFVDAREKVAAPAAKGKAKAQAPLFKVTTKYPDYFPFMENASSGEARRRLYVAFQSREAARNTPLLQEAIALRDEQAKLLGFKTHADYVEEDQMAKDSATVASFLSDLRARLQAKRDSDYAKMAALKRADTKDPKAVLEPWDVSYYLNKIKQRDYTLDTEALREYFPVDTVLNGMFRVYERLLGLEIKEVAGAKAWSPDVKLFEVKDRASGEHIAQFYLDLYPRPGKYGHAAAAPVTIARRLNGTYRAPIALMMANFSPPTADRPSLFTHDEVKTLFHEFGHIMHQTLTSARYGSQAGTAVSRDFVEAPSQMFENWVFEKESLDMMSGHFQDSSKKLPAETIARIKEARVFDAGFRYMRQVFLASFDQKIHTSGPKVDVNAVDTELYRAIVGMTPVSGTSFPATFGHMMGGYDAGYYGYLWSEVYADDLFTAFAAKGVLDPETGMRLRKTVLEKGRSEDADALMRQFLGREANNAAFLKKIGIE